MLELAVLGLLQGQELHGYEIRKRLRDDLGQLSNVSFGSLYPALSRLERSGAVESLGESAGAEALVPMTGSLSGERAAMRARRSATPRGRRGRKVYRITDEGRRQFTELLERDPASGGDDARTFGLRLAFARHMPPAARMRLLERRRAQLADHLVGTRAAAESRQDLDPYARSLIEHTAESTEREIRWLDRLIADERGDVAPGGRRAHPTARTALEAPDVVDLVPSTPADVVDLPAAAGPIEQPATAGTVDRPAPAGHMEGATS